MTVVTRNNIGERMSQPAFTKNVGTKQSLESEKVELYKLLNYLEGVLMDTMIGIKKRQLNASLTLEAALVLPVFIFAICAILFFLQVLYVQEGIQQGLYKTAKYCSELAYGYDYVINYDSKSKSSEEPLENSISKSSEESLKNSVNKSSPESLENSVNKSSPESLENTENKSSEESLEKTESSNLVSKVLTVGAIRSKFCSVTDNQILNMPCVVNGENGVLLSLSSYYDETDEVDVITYYSINTPINVFNLQRIPVVQRIRVKAFVGTREEKGQDGDEKGSGDESNKDEIVYITQTGTVYHRSKECTHLKLSIRMVTSEQLESLRNKGGGKYYPCEICARTKGKQESYYITDQGDRYHSDIQCSGLKRTIYEIPLSKVEDRLPCSRCGQ